MCKHSHKVKLTIVWTVSPLTPNSYIEPLTLQCVFGNEGPKEILEVE